MGTSAVRLQAARQSASALATYALSERACATGGAAQSCTARTASSAPWMPAAPSLCPKHAFTEPEQAHRGFGLADQRKFLKEIVT